MIRNKVRKVRKLRGLNLEDLATLAEMSTGHLSRIERHERGWSMESLPKLAKALGVELHELIDSNEAWQDAPVIGVIGQTQWGRFVVAGEQSSAGMTARVPAVLGDVVAFSVVGTALYPRYTIGDVIIAQDPPVAPDSVLGKECVIRTTDGRLAVKYVQQTGKEGVFQLTSHNEPPSEDTPISACYRIVYILR